MQLYNALNLPLRLLIYITAKFEGIVARTGVNIYGRKQIRLPAPRCVVFYNGESQVQDEQVLRLSDAFTDEGGAGHKSCLELTVRMLNINYGHNEELLKCCGRLGEYSLFIAKIREFQRAGLSSDEAVDSAVSFCIGHNVTADILRPFQAEVKKMLLTEYNEKIIMRLFQKEAREEGFRKGREEGRKEGKAAGQAECILQLLEELGEVPSTLKKKTMSEKIPIP